jgi:hypothetical protein
MSLISDDEMGEIKSAPANPSEKALDPHHLQLLA